MSTRVFRVLVVEDEELVSALLEDFLAELDCQIVGPAVTLEEGLEAAASGDFDAAVLDVNLGGKRTFPVADALATNGKPFAFSTGYGVDGLRPQDASRPILHKPFSFNDLAAVVDRLAAEATR